MESNEGGNGTVNRLILGILIGATLPTALAWAAFFSDSVSRDEMQKAIGQAIVAERSLTASELRGLRGELNSIQATLKRIEDKQ